MAFFDEFQRLKIQLEDIKSATDNFGSNNLIGSGGFGKVYKGEISHSKGRSMVAFKRLDTRLGQGNSEFWREIMMLSRYTHENLISLLGYCDEGGEKILVYEYASRGSLDRHLHPTALTWMQRLKICLGVARGLTYLHDPMGEQQRVIHRDIKSANILLDENWNAKLSDMGLSKIGPANQQHTALVTNAVGTLGYLDPLYLEMSVLTKESDVYSFGAVLFEAMCGRLCYEYSNSKCQILVRRWKKSYKQKKLDEIISEDLLQQMDKTSLETFSDIAYQCLQKTREERPLMAHVVKRLEIALQFQETCESEKFPEEYEEIIKSAIPPVNFISRRELQGLLSKGILLNGGKNWFSLNKYGEHCELISAAELSGRNFKNSKDLPKENSRFATGAFILADYVEFIAHARAQFLTPGITYTVNLVFKPRDAADRKSSKQTLINFRYRIVGETRSSTSYVAYRREDGWMMVELYLFTSDKTTFDLDIQCEVPILIDIVVEGIEFRPLERSEASVDEKVDMQQISYIDTDWKGQLLDDYEEIVSRSKDSLEWTTQKELHFLFSKGFLIDDGEEWFSLAKNGKKSFMLSAKAAFFLKNCWDWKSLPESRFELVACECKDMAFIISFRGRRSNMLSLGTRYACYLVYKITEYHSKFEVPMEVTNDYDPYDFWYIYLVSPQTPVIRPNIDQTTHNLHMTKIKGRPQLRNDGWMEVQVWEFQTSTFEMIRMRLWLRQIKREKLNGLIVEGIEVKPL